MENKVYEINKMEYVEHTDWLILTNNSPILDKADCFGSISNLVIIEVNEQQYEVRITANEIIKRKIDYQNEDTDYGFVRLIMARLNIGADDIIYIDTTFVVVPILSFIYEYLKRVIKVKCINLIYNEIIRYQDPYQYEYNVEPLSTKLLDCYPQGTKTKQELIVYLIGFEANCTMRIDREREPVKKIIINGFPPYLLGYKDISLLNNKHLQSDDFVLDYCTALNPFKMFNKLHTIYKQYGNSYRISIAACGSTPSSIGAIMFASYIQDVDIITIRPSRYNFPYRHVKNTWVYRV